MGEAEPFKRPEQEGATDEGDHRVLHQVTAIHVGVGRMDILYVLHCTSGTLVRVVWGRICFTALLMRPYYVT